MILRLPVLVASKTVGKAVGFGESVKWFISVAQGWRQVWQSAELTGVHEVVVPMAVDERAHSWYCVSVTPASDRGTLEEASGLGVIIHDSDRMRGQEVERVVRNVDALIRGLWGRFGGEAPLVEHAAAPTCDALAQRMLSAFGCVVARVAHHAGESFPDTTQKYFAADFGRVLERIFSHLRSEVAARGVVDIDVLLDDAVAARALLQMFTVLPRLVLRKEGIAGDACAFGFVCATERARPVSGVLRCATWNIAVGKKSAQAPRGWTFADASSW